MSYSKRGKSTPAPIANASEPQNRPLISINTALPVAEFTLNSNMAGPDHFIAAHIFATASNKSSRNGTLFR